MLASLTRRKRWLCGNLLLRFGTLAPLGRQNIALINPCLDANHTKSRVCLGQAIVDIGTQGVQGDLSLDLFLGASNFRSTQSPANNNPYTFGICTHRLLYCLLHSTAERDALL
jgi:hypothetical protein